MHIPLLLLFALSFFLLTGNSLAHEPSRAGNASPAIDLDSIIYQDDSFDSRINIDLPMTGGELFFLNAGYSEIQTGESPLVLYSAGTGLQRKFADKFLFGGEIESWGNDSAITTQRFALNLGYTGRLWQLTLQPVYRRLSIFSEDFSRDSEVSTRARLGVDNIGFVGQLGYFSSENWSHKLHGRYHYYSKDMSRFDVSEFDRRYEQLIGDLKDRGLTDEQIDFILNSDPVSFLTVAKIAGFSEETISNILKLRQNLYKAATVFDVFGDAFSLSAGFQKYSVGYELSYYGESWDFLIDVSRSQSAVTLTGLNALYLGAGYRFGHWYNRLAYSTNLKDLSSWAVQLSLSISFR